MELSEGVLRYYSDVVTGRQVRRPLLGWGGVKSLARTFLGDDKKHINLSMQRQRDFWGLRSGLLDFFGGCF